MDTLLKGLEELAQASDVATQRQVVDRLLGALPAKGGGGAGPVAPTDRTGGGDNAFDPNDLPAGDRQRSPEEAPEPRTDERGFEASDLMGAPQARLASHGGDYAVDELAGASNPAYLEETPEVRITDAIEAKAAELDHDPVAIHAWVRNNVAWIPSWGATQSADHTLSSQRGNAADIAGLEIALLRASDPAVFTEAG